MANNPIYRKKGTKEVGSIQLATQRDVVELAGAPQATEQELGTPAVSTGTGGGTGPQGPQGPQGPAGLDGSYPALIYRNATTQPSTPTGGSYDGTTFTPPAGWTHFPVDPAAGLLRWMSLVYFADNGTVWAPTGAWSTPARDFEKGDKGDTGDTGPAGSSHEVDLGQYLDDTGGDNFQNWRTVEDALQPNGGVHSVIVAYGGQGYSYLGGGGTGASAVAQVHPQITVTGGGVGAVAPTGYAVVGSAAQGGAIHSVMITSAGSGWRLVTRQCSGGALGNGIVSGSDIIKINGGYANGPLYNITVGMSVDHPAFPIGTTVVALTAGDYGNDIPAQVQVSSTASFTTGYQFVYFGKPVITVTDQGQTPTYPALLVGVVGEGVTARIPAGRYASAGCDLNTLHNVTLECDGAVIDISGSKDNNGFLLGPECIHVDVRGLTVQGHHINAVSEVPNEPDANLNPNRRGTQFGYGIKGRYVHLERCEAKNIAQFGFHLVGPDQATSALDAPYLYAGPMSMSNCAVVEGGADGIHIGLGVAGVTIDNVQLLELSDDGIATSPDTGGLPFNYSYGIVITNVLVRNNSFRGIDIQYVKNVAIANAVIDSVGGYGMEIHNVDDVVVSGVSMFRVGGTGVGYRNTILNRYGFKISNVNRLSASALAFGAISDSFLVHVTGSTDVLVNAQTIQGKTLFGDGGGNNNVTVGS